MTDQAPTEPQDEHKLVTNCRSCIECCTNFGIGCLACLNDSISIFTGFIYLIIIFGGIISEIIMLARLENKEDIIFIISCVQTCMAAIGAVPMGLYIFKYGCPGFMRSPDVWCAPITDFRGLFTGGYSVYCLVPWWLINMCASWYYVQAKFEWYTHFMVYVPALIYLPFVFAGFSIGRVCFGNQNGS